MLIYFNIFVSFFLLSCSSLYQSKKIKLSQDIYQKRLAKSEFHDGRAPYGSYLTLDLKYAPYHEIFEELQKDYPSLKSRGEAHITVVTPIEFHQQLEKYVSIKKLFKKAKGNNIQQASFEILCLGRGKREINGKEESTFYLVLNSPEIVLERKKIKKLIKNKGKFDPLKYYPHITIGFTQRDLHESDGVIKDINSCYRDIVFE